MTTLAVMQPGYLPWLGFFDKARLCDVFVIYDSVQYVKNDFHNRNRIRSLDDWVWLTVPVQAQGFPAIADVKIDNARLWGRKHAATIRQAYGKAPYFGDYWEDIEGLLGQQWDRLVDLQMGFIRLHLDWLGFRPRVVMASSLPIESEDRNLKLVEMCQLFGATIYLSGDVAKDYLDVSLFAAVGVEVKWQGWLNPVYPQFREGFMPQLAAIDLLMNCGKESSKYFEGASQVPVVRNPVLMPNGGELGVTGVGC
ncbi:WbqC family protein [Nostoc flagelliforme]|uniref:WbqC family protein n=1 Tax=Nostoc flagelliforme TaxID=1306274 RepID=UPI000C2D3CC9|nr:WbqC family protein [Nostoc flagelliforme]